MIPNKGSSKYKNYDVDMEVITTCDPLNYKLIDTKRGAEVHLLTLFTSKSPSFIKNSYTVFYAKVGNYYTSYSLQIIPSLRYHRNEYRKLRARYGHKLHLKNTQKSEGKICMHHAIYIKMIITSYTPTNLHKVQAD